MHSNSYEYLQLYGGEAGLGYKTSFPRLTSNQNWGLGLTGQETNISSEESEMVERHRWRGENEAIWSWLLHGWNCKSTMDKRVPYTS